MEFFVSIIYNYCTIVLSSFYMIYDSDKLVYESLFFCKNICKYIYVRYYIQYSLKTYSKMSSHKENIWTAEMAHYLFSVVYTYI